MWRVSKSADPDQTLRLHFLHMSEGPFSHNAGHNVDLPEEYFAIHVYVSVAKKPKAVSKFNNFEVEDEDVGTQKHR